MMMKATEGPLLPLGEGGVYVHVPLVVLKERAGAGWKAGHAVGSDEVCR